MRPWTLLLTVAPPRPILELIWPVFGVLGLLAFWAGRRRRRWLAAALLVIILAFGAEMHHEFLRDAEMWAEIYEYEQAGQLGPPAPELRRFDLLTPQWRAAYLAFGIGVALAVVGLWPARRPVRDA